MIFVTGPLFAGKEETICRCLGWTPSDFRLNACVRDVHDLAADCDDLIALADELADKAVVIATEVGGGVVPVDAGQRHAREQAGRLACLLAERADTVVRVCCGIPQVLKGTLPSDMGANDDETHEDAAAASTEWHENSAAASTEMLHEMP